jgi:hypothetical protein
VFLRSFYAGGSISYGYACCGVVLMRERRRQQRDKSDYCFYILKVFLKNLKFIYFFTLIFYFLFLDNIKNI